jgi:hypothetical protein
VTATVAGFTTFIRNVMGITSDFLPDDSAAIVISLNVALAITNPQLALVGIPNTTPPVSLYDLAVYNLAGDNLINYTIDPTDAPLVNVVGPNGTTIEVGFFESLRYKWGIAGFQPGVVASVSDVTTSTTLEVIEAAENFTLGDLQNLKTPYGRQYLAIAQRYGALWGLS